MFNQPLYLERFPLHEEFQAQEEIDAKPFSPDAFQEQANIAVTRLKTFLSDTSLRGLERSDPTELLQAARKLMIDPDIEPNSTFNAYRFEAILELYIKTGIQVYSPSFMGRQYSGVVPLSGVVDMVSSILNQPSSFYEAAQLPNVAERIMSTELNHFIGYDPVKYSMITTSGGSLANMTALLAARNVHYPDFWEKGCSIFVGKRLPAIAMSEEVHYSLRRAIGILGIGDEQIVTLPVNTSGQIEIKEVRNCLKSAYDQGLDVFCLVASIGTTSLGAIDPIDELAEIATEKGLWFHVDGAHGASLLISDTYRNLIKGINKADSLTWDAHKMMFMPSPCTMLFYKNKNASYGAFRQEASYVFDDFNNETDAFESAKTNFECTKRPLIMNLWVLWSMYGKNLFKEKIEYLCHLCRSSYEILLEQHDFEIIHKPESNILCFRYTPNGGEQALPSNLQDIIREEIIKQGHYFISKVKIGGKMALRVVFMNHRTTTQHFNMLLQEIRRIGLKELNNPK